VCECLTEQRVLTFLNMWSQDWTHFV